MTSIGNIFTTFAKTGTAFVAAKLTEATAAMQSQLEVAPILSMPPIPQPPIPQPSESVMQVPHSVPLPDAPSIVIEDEPPANPDYVQLPMSYRSNLKIAGLDNSIESWLICNGAQYEALCSDGLFQYHMMTAEGICAWLRHRGTNLAAFSDATMAGYKLAEKLKAKHGWDYRMVFTPVLEEQVYTLRCDIAFTDVNNAAAIQVAWSRECAEVRDACTSAVEFFRGSVNTFLDSRKTATGTDATEYDREETLRNSGNPGVRGYKHGFTKIPTETSRSYNVFGVLLYEITTRLPAV